MFKKKMKQIGAMAMAASMISKCSREYQPGIECNGNSIQLRRRKRNRKDQ